jgi:hypothetical protein
MTGLTLLPTKKQSRESTGRHAAERPGDARRDAEGRQDRTLAANWAPDSTLIIDTQHGTDLLPGEHFVSHVNDWTEFCGVVDKLCAGEHEFRTVVIDMVDDVFRFADRHYAGPGQGARDGDR